MKNGERQTLLTIKTYLSRLMWWCVGPLILLALALAGFHIHTIQAQLDREASDWAHNLAASIDHDLAARISALQDLAAGALLDDPPRLEEFYREAQIFREHHTGHVVLADLSTRMLINTRAPLGSPLPLLPVPKGHAAVPAVLKTGKPAVGDMFYGPIAKKPLVAIAVPVMRHEQMKGLLLGIIDAAQYQKMLDALSIPPGWGVKIVDGKGDAMALRPQPDKGAEPGERRIGAKLEASPWSVVLTIPSAVYYAPLMKTTALLAATIVFISLVGIIAGRRFGRRLGDAVRSLAEQSPHAGSGPLVAEIEGVRTLLKETDEAREISEKELRQSEARYRSLFEAANIGKSMTLLSGEINVNRAFCEMLGYSQEELKGKTWQALTPAEDVGPITEILAALISGERNTARFEKRYIHKNGSLIWADVSVVLKRGSDGNPLHFITTMVDVSKRKQAEMHLHESEERYRNLIEVAPVGIAVHSDGRVVFCNREGARLLGADSPEQIAGKSIFEIIDPDRREESKSRILRMMKGEKGLYPAQDVYRRMDGVSIDVEVIATALDYQGKPAVQVIVQDITERKRAEQERERLRTAIEQTGEAIMITSPSGIIQYVNPAFEAISGFDRKEAIGNPPRILKSGKQDEAFYHNLWETISGGRTWEGRLVNKRKDGKLYTEAATISPVRDATGRIVNYVAVKRDITEHLLLTEQFEQSQKMEAVGQLAGGVAHDYNNMLSVIMGYTELALEKTEPADSLNADLQEVFNAAKRSADITRQLLAFARKQAAAPVALDLNQTLESMFKMLRRLIGEDISLTWLPGQGLWPVLIDPSQVDQIVANICVNARDAIQGVGKITVETNNVVFDEAYCAWHSGVAPGEFVMLAVSDNGCGMDKETLAHVFEPFFTTKELGRGTGLGLSTVYGIVKQNGGFINVYSEMERGTTFRIYLPRHAGDAFAPKAQGEGKIKYGSGETLLLVEDEASILKMAKKMLEELGYSVLTAGSPGEALDLAESQAGNIDLLITDVVMPEMNGKELSERVGKLYPGIKTLFMSGYTANVIAHHGVLKSGVHYMQKPFSLAEMAAKVDKALHTKGAGS